MAGGTDWSILAPSIIAAAGFGTIAGAAITTYGGRGQQRREVRSRALDCLEHLEVIRSYISTEEAMQGHEFSERLEARQMRVNCMLAGVPRRIIDTYEKICNDAWMGPCSDLGDRVLTVMLPEGAARLVRDALYSPTLTRVTYRWRVKKLRYMAWNVYGPSPNVCEWTSLPRLYQAWRRRENCVEEGRDKGKASAESLTPPKRAS